MRGKITTDKRHYQGLLGKNESLEMSATEEEEKALRSIVNGRLLTAPQFQQLSDLPPEVEWLANIANVHTRRAYQNDVQEFMAFVGIEARDEIRQVTRAHIIAWRETLKARACRNATVRRKLSALSSLFAFLCDQNAVSHNPVDGVKRPQQRGQVGTTPALDATLG